MSAAPTLAYVSHEEFVTHVEAIARAIEADGWMPGFIVGIGRGGLAPAVYLSHRIGVPTLSVDHSSRVFGFADALLINLAHRSAAGERLLFVDDINDTGGTIRYLREALAREGAAAGAVRFATLIDNSRSEARVDYAGRVIDRATNKDWFVFPWEAMAPRDVLVGEAEAVPERLGGG